MKLPRRRFLQLAAGAAVLAAISRMARAQTYPARPVRIIVGFPAGTSADIFARSLGQLLSERLNASFIVENRPGAGTTIAAQAVVGAPPDGHTLLWATAANATSATFYDNLSFNFIRDIAPVAGMIRTLYVMVANPSLPAKTIPELIAYAKANPGKINMASGGNGTQLHLAGELFKMMTGVDTVHVPYRGDGPALTDLIGGQVEVMFAGLPASIEHIRAGRLRALAVTTATRFEALPDIPTMGEFVPGYEASGFQGLGAPRSTPAEIVDKLNKEVNAALADPKVKARLVEMGNTVLAGSPADFGKLIAGETEKWAKVVKFASIKPDCWRIGAATGGAGLGCRSSSWSSARPARPRISSACTTAVG
jgi:tripartite-type tricarboxylate transporter receptor subunit TctC